MNSRVKVLSISGILIMLLTITLGFLNIEEWNNTNIVSFIFILLAEIIFFGGFILVEKTYNDFSKTFYRGITFSVITLYTLATIITSLVFIIFTEKAFRSLLTIQLIILAIFLIAFITVYSISKKLKDSDEKILGSTSRIENYINRLNLLKSQDSSKPYSLRIKKLAEDLRFTDISTTVLADDDIELVISKLEEELNKDEDLSEKEIELLCSKISNLIERRKLEVHSLKRGGI
ncbi:hypothetical protein [Miniphocaeibacter massiliensis]|uniref:hypothetical protein n=1 Tax=Miniphocaeibacter massiliensis TaxID=2041841 RepID=UPI000C1B7EF1|nr:hypothetical protein [Miniphocaeibacter massiliensis]